MPVAQAGPALVGCETMDFERDSLPVAAVVAFSVMMDGATAAEVVGYWIALLLSLST